MNRSGIPVIVGVVVLIATAVLMSLLFPWDEPPKIVRTLPLSGVKIRRLVHLDDRADPNNRQLVQELIDEDRLAFAWLEIAGEDGKLTCLIPVGDTLVRYEKQYSAGLGYRASNIEAIEEKKVFMPTLRSFVESVLIVCSVLAITFGAGSAAILVAWVANWMRQRQIEEEPEPPVN